MRLRIARYLLLTIIFLSPQFLYAEDHLAKESDLGFMATITGAINDKIKAPGVFIYLPPSGSTSFAKPPAYSIADNSGARKLGITFTIPFKTTSGTYELISPHPFDTRKSFSVRVDTTIDGKVTSYSKNTQGKLNLDSIVENPKETAEKLIKGSFEFSTQNSGGKKLSAKGEFKFYRK